MGGVAAGALTRAALGRGVCAQEQWRNAKGAYCTASARKALPALAQQLGLPLPPAQAGPRDACLGWDERRRGARIDRVLHNDRFLLLGSVQVPNLASHVLG